MPDVPVPPEIAVPDYALAEVVEVTTHEQMKAFADPTRSAIVMLLLERAASTTELAVALDKPKGTVDHHLKVLAKAGLVHVVRTRQVRAMTEKFWGRTARTFLFTAASDDVPAPMWMTREAYEEMQRSLPGQLVEERARGAADGADHPDTTFSTLRHARIPAERVAEFGRRLYELSDEFAASPRGGDVMYGMLLALYPTDHRVLPEAVS